MNHNYNTTKIESSEVYIPKNSTRNIIRQTSDLTIEYRPVNAVKIEVARTEVITINVKE